MLEVPAFAVEIVGEAFKATLDLVTLQEQLMVARIRFQDGVADLSLEKSSDEKKPDLKVVDDKAKG